MPYFPWFYTYLLASLCVCVCIFCHNVLFVCLCVITWQKIDQAVGPETFFNFVWPKFILLQLLYTYK